MFIVMLVFFIYQPQNMQKDDLERVYRVCILQDGKTEMAGRKNIYIYIFVIFYPLEIFN